MFAQRTQLEQTNLSEAEISRLIKMINLSVVEALENSNEIPEEKITGGFYNEVSHL